MPGATRPATGARTVKAKIMEADIKALMRTFGPAIGANERTLMGLLTKFVSKALLDVCEIMLERAVGLAPYETGELRSSGVVSFYLGQGGTSTLAADTDADGAGNYTINRTFDYLSRGTTKIEAEISFFREDRGLDIALWAHEDLQPWVPRPKTESQKGEWFARQKGTGPKYLSRAVGEYQGKLQGLLGTAALRAMYEYNRMYGRRGGPTGSPPPVTPPPRPPKIRPRKDVWEYQEKMAKETGFRPSFKAGKEALSKGRRGRK